MKALQIERLRKIVIAQYPGSRIWKTRRGKFTIVQEQEDLTVKDLLSEFFFPAAESELEAWVSAASVVKIEKNFNRTHPFKADLFDIESKMQRVSIRNINSARNKNRSKN
jgi:hypothetical protein